MKIKVYAAKSADSKSIEVAPQIFGMALNQKLVSQDVQRVLANRRQVVASTKNRGEVSGGGRKPFRQKGTGNARAGSNRSPIWRGGGVTFGPTASRNFQKNMPHKMKRTALLMLLSEKLKTNKLIVVEKLVFPKISTKSVQDFLEKLPIEEGKILVVLSLTNVNLELSAANLAYIKIVQVPSLNIIDLLKYDYLLTDKEGIAAIEKQFGAKK